MTLIFIFTIHLRFYNVIQYISYRQHRKPTSCRKHLTVSVAVIFVTFHNQLASLALLTLHNKHFPSLRIDCKLRLVATSVSRWLGQSIHLRKPRFFSFFFFMFLCFLVHLMLVFFVFVFFKSYLPCLFSFLSIIGQVCTWYMIHHSCLVCQVGNYEKCECETSLMMNIPPDCMVEKGTLNKDPYHKNSKNFISGYPFLYS